MIKIKLSIILSFFICMHSYAQKGTVSFEVSGEPSINIKESIAGYGVYVKSSYGISSLSELTFTCGFSRFSGSKPVLFSKQITRVVPFMVGYRRNISGFYIESRLGLGEFGGKQTLDGAIAKPSVLAMLASAGGGYTYKRWNMGINYTLVNGIDNASAGYWNNKRFNYASLSVGYRFVILK